MVLNPAQRLFALVVAVPGAIACLLAMGAFLKKIVDNRIAGPVPGAERQYYIAVGDAYSGGFVTGFFFCFFLLLAGLVVSHHFEMRRARVGTRSRAETTAS